jgi:hypothetical protein
MRLKSSWLFGLPILSYKVGRLLRALNQRTIRTS